LSTTTRKTRSMVAEGCSDDEDGGTGLSPVMTASVAIGRELAGG
jgi:hypothetical protein